MSIIYKAFRTPLYSYVYDRNTNRILRINEEDYKELNSRNPNAKVLKKFQKRGFLLEDKLKEIEHPDTKIVEHILDKKMEYLLLQVTQECNLRCSYCVYGGKYENRVHTNLDMSLELAQKAICYYVDRTTELDELTLGFYGGEPLLKMDLIKHCVIFIKTLVPDKKITFTLTTNGTLLTYENAKYLYENGFNVVISLDGSRDEHNRNRIFKNSNVGSFDVIMNNLKMIKEQLPDFMKNISFNTVLNHNSNFSCVKDYYNTNEIVKDAYSVFNLVEENNAKENGEFNKQFLIEYKYEQFLLFMYILGKCDKRYLLGAQLTNIVFYRDFWRILKESGSIGKKCHHNGPCIPGGRRLFVSVTGDFYPCEKVPEEEITRIGSIDEGIDKEICKKMLNIGKLSEDCCKQCWALRVCDQCVAKTIENNMFSQSKKLACCQESKSVALDKLKVMSMFNEFGVNIEEVNE